MATLPDPSLIKRGAPTPAGPAGGLTATRIGTPGADTSIGDALRGIGDEAFKFAMREKARMDDVAIDDAKNQYIQRALELEGEYSQIKGKNAVDQDIVADFTKKLDGISEELTPNFKNDSQRRAWDSYYGKSKVQFTAGVMKHKLAESDKYAADTYQATNITRMQNAHSNWADPSVVNSSAADIVRNVAKEKARAGWDAERTELELRSALGPLWSGVAAQYINVKQYKMAKKILDQHKDVIGVDKYLGFHKSIEASETIDLSQEKAANIIGTVEGSEAQRKAAREIGGTLGDATLQRVKTYQMEERVQREENKRIQSEHDSAWVSDTGIEALSNDRLTVDQVKSAGLSDENEALWMTKAINQGITRNKAAMAASTKDTYALWIARASLEPEKWTLDDVANEINPNGGGLTGPQYNTIRTILNENQVKTPKTSAASAATKGKAMLKSMYDRGDFGVVKTGKKAKKTEAWKTYSDILIDYQRKIIDDPTVDHTDWLNQRIEKEGMQSLYDKLDSDWQWGPFMDESDEIISEWLRQRGKAVSRKNIDAVRKRYGR
jgi:hypothetical protein